MSVVGCDEEIIEMWPQNCTEKYVSTSGKTIVPKEAFHSIICVKRFIVPS